jgi:hypothetical protein
MIIFCSSASGVKERSSASTALNHFHARWAGMSFGRLDTIFIAVGLLTIASGIFARLTLYREVKKLDQPASS